MAVGFFFLDFEAFQFARNGSREWVVPYRERMNAVVGRKLPGQVLDFETDHFRNIRLSKPAEFIHVGYNDGMERFPFRST